MMFTKFRAAVHSVATGLGVQASDTPAISNNGRKAKYCYSRPTFLQLNSADEIQVAGDSIIRPIIVPRDIVNMPWMSGYAETVNAGKSPYNEDNGCVHVGELHVCRTGDGDCSQPGTDLQSLVGGGTCPRRLRYFYFALFDGHAGHGASIAASRQLHLILHAKLERIIDHLLPSDCVGVTSINNEKSTFLWIPMQEMAVEKLIIGALEDAFHDMDTAIAEDRIFYDMRGGCTALVALFLLGRLFVANAGDSRAVVCRDGQVLHTTHDFTPETEHQRIRHLAFQNPHLLGDEFTYLDFSRRVTRRDVGSPVLCRQPHMTGWSYKTVSEKDLRFPLICGEGKRSRVCATIGVTRGFGDHDLCAYNTGVRIKPFLSSQPEVLVVDMSTLESVSPADCLVMATDGLWDVLPSESVAALVSKAMAYFPEDLSNGVCYRYTSTAQDLVMAARGKLKDGLWKRPDGSSATIDDISVFVVPLQPYQFEYQLETQNNLQGSLSSSRDSTADDVVTSIDDTS